MIEVGDYIRWISGIAVFSADEDGCVKPVEKIYSYGIVVEVALGGEISDDVVIAFCSNENQWFVATIDDPEYEIEVISKVKDET